jgi:hypothetical protein
MYNKNYKVGNFISKKLLTAYLKETNANYGLAVLPQVSVYVAFSNLVRALKNYQVYARDKAKYIAQKKLGATFSKAMTVPNKVKGQLRKFGYNSRQAVSATELV